MIYNTNAYVENPYNGETGLNGQCTNSIPRSRYIRGTKKMVPLKDNNVATFEVLEDDWMEHVKRDNKTVDRLLQE